MPVRRFRWDASLPAFNLHENGSILFPSAPWKLWLCLRLFGLLKLLLYRFCIPLSDALDELAERNVHAGPGIWLLTALVHALSTSAPRQTFGPHEQIIHAVAARYCCTMCIPRHARRRMLGIRTYIDRAIRQIAAPFEPIASAEHSLGSAAARMRNC